jgi:hypothetical protein
MKLRIDMDDGSFPIARSLLLWLAKTKLSSSQRAVIDVILCQTYGFYEHLSPKLQKLKRRKVKAQIPFTLFMKHTWINKPNLSRAIKSLKRAKIILVDESTRPYTYSFNVEVGQWPVDILRKNIKDVIESDNLKLSNLITSSYQNRQPLVIKSDNKIFPNSLSFKKNQNPKENIKEIYIKKNIKEKDNFSKISLFKNKKSNFREYLKEPIHIGELIKQEFGKEVKR